MLVYQRVMFLFNLTQNLYDSEAPMNYISFDQLPQQRRCEFLRQGTEAELEEVDGHEGQQHQTWRRGSPLRRGVLFLTKRTVKDVYLKKIGNVLES